MYFLLGVIAVIFEGCYGIEGDTTSVTCQSLGVCMDLVTKENFTCLDKRLECCTDETNHLALHRAPRGIHCCPGYGMFDHQTHSCDDGHLTLRTEALLCPGSSSVYYNPNTQVCCQSLSAEPTPHLKEDRHKCAEYSCGDKYIRNSTSDCCGGEKYDKRKQCCGDNYIVKPKEQCEPHAQFVTEGCSMFEMEKRFKQQKQQGSYMYAFQVAKAKPSRGRGLVYKVKFAKQFVGAQGKLKAVKKNLRSFTMPEDGCPGRLRIGAYYVVMSKSKARSKHLELRGDKYFIIPVESSDIFAKIFSL